MREEQAGLWGDTHLQSFQHLFLFSTLFRRYTVQVGKFETNIYLHKRSQVYCLHQSYLLLKLIEAGQFWLSWFNVIFLKRQKPERREINKNETNEGEKKKKTRLEGYEQREVCNDYPLSKLCSQINKYF